jgi:hypothetical protein
MSWDFQSTKIHLNVIFSSSSPTLAFDDGPLKNIAKI